MGTVWARGLELSLAERPGAESLARRIRQHVKETKKRDSYYL